MGTSNFSDDFKRDAVAQITERGYPVAEVSKRLGESQHSLYAWKKTFSKPADPGKADQAAEIRRLKQELARVTEERDILKKATAYFAKDGKGRFLDNIFIERLWRTLKCECVYLHAWETGSQPRVGVRKWVDF